MYSKIKLLFLILFLFLTFPQKTNAQVVINEFLPDSPTEWVEFYNASDSADYIKGYYIDDDTDFLSDSGSSAKKLLTNLVTSNPNFPYFETTSFLNNSGDYVVLFDSIGTLIDQYQYVSNPGLNLTIGRYPNGSGLYYFLPYSTKADSNPSPPTSTPTAEPTAQPTNAPTTAPTAVPTVKPTPTKSPSPKPTASPTPSDEPEETDEPAEILGMSTDNDKTITPESRVAGDLTEKKSPILAIIFVILGTGCLGYVGYLIYNGRHVKTSDTS